MLIINKIYDASNSLKLYTPHLCVWVGNFWQGHVPSPGSHHTSYKVQISIWPCPTARAWKLLTTSAPLSPVVMDNHVVQTQIVFDVTICWPNKFVCWQSQGVLWWWWPFEIARGHGHVGMPALGHGGWQAEQGQEWTSSQRDWGDPSPPNQFCPRFLGYRNVCNSKIVS